MRLFEIDPNDSTVALNKEWIMLIPEFNALLKRDKGSKGDYRGDNKLKAKREFTFIYFYADFASPLRDWKEEEKKTEALRYAGLTGEDLDQKVLEALEVYMKLMLKVSRALRTYRSMLKSLDEMDDYLENLDMSAKDKKGELVNNPLTVASFVDKMDKVYTSVKNFEKRVEEELKLGSTGIRGTAELGEMELTGKRVWSEQDISSGSKTTKVSATFQSMMENVQELNLIKDDDTEEENDIQDDMEFGKE